jgi:hypothetical protein
VAALLLLASTEASAQPSCPSASTAVYSGDLGLNQSATINIDLQPCETVKVTLDGIGSTHPNGSAGIEYKIRNSSAQVLTFKSSQCGTSCSWVLPDPPVHYPGGILPGTRGAAGLAKDVVVTVWGFNWFGGPTAHYTLTVIRTPRPGYNLGGTGFSDALQLSDEIPQYGSVHKWEPGQFYKLHINSGEQIYVSGQALGKKLGTLFKMSLYDSNQQLVFTLLNLAVWDTPKYFPSDGQAPSSYVYKHNGASGDFVLKVWADPGYQDYVMDFNFQVQRGPRLIVTPTALTRGESATFAIQGALNATISNWAYATAANGSVTRTTGTGALTWGGTIVDSGTGSVQVVTNGITYNLSQPLTVTPRSWFFLAATAEKRSNPHSKNCRGSQIQLVAVSPEAGAAGSGFFQACVEYELLITDIGTVPDGPNKNLKWIMDVRDRTTADWVAHIDVETPTSDWYVHQCGDWVAAPGSTCSSPIGNNRYISGLNTLASHGTKLDRKTVTTANT